MSQRQRQSIPEREPEPNTASQSSCLLWWEISFGGTSACQQTEPESLQCSLQVRREAGCHFSAPTPKADTMHPNMINVFGIQYLFLYFNSFSSAVAGGRAFMSRVKSKISIFQLYTSQLPPLKLVLGNEPFKTS